MANGLRSCPVVGLRKPANTTALASRSWRTHFARFFAGDFGDWRACELLRTGFVQNRERLFGSSRAVVFDLFYGDASRLAEWRAAAYPGLEAIQTDGGHDPADA